MTPTKICSQNMPLPKSVVRLFQLRPIRLYRGPLISESIQLESGIPKLENDACISTLPPRQVSQNIAFLGESDNANKVEHTIGS